LEEESAKPKLASASRVSPRAWLMTKCRLFFFNVLVLTPLRQTPFVAFSVIKIGTFILTIGVQLSMAH
jgi:hypothetical protein